MKVVALISGGKDSCYNMMQCVAEGHDIVALANLRPKDKDELDSYMYQTVGHHAIGLYAEAMDVPLFRRTITGSSVNTGRDYQTTADDEVEDLFLLLKQIKEEVGVEAVSVGAILSDYQRVRVEHVCVRLGLTPLSYLWRRDQQELLQEILSCNLHAIIIKVAAMGLLPSKHLGKSLADIYPHMVLMKEKYGLNVCGEGGEYETFTLDCPLFNKKIVLDEVEKIIHSDDAFAPVGYLNLKSLHLDDKHLTTDDKRARLKDLPLKHSSQIMQELFPDGGSSFKDEVQPDLAGFCSKCVQRRLEGNHLRIRKQKSGHVWISGLNAYTQANSTLQDLIKSTLDRLVGGLEGYGLTFKDVLLVCLYVQDMKEFVNINRVYNTYFDINPPARVCVEASLPENVVLQVDCVAYRDNEHSQQERHTMHVQGISHWANANIGPYSQAVRLGESVYIAGQIALCPATMSIIEGGILPQCRLSLRNVRRVLEAMCPVATLRNIVEVICYVTHPTYIKTAEQEWQRALSQKQSGGSDIDEDNRCLPLVEYVVIPALPKQSLVEWQVYAHTGDDCGTAVEMCRQTTDFSLAIQAIAFTRDPSFLAFRARIECSISGDCEAKTLDVMMVTLAEVIWSVLERGQLEPTHVGGLRIFYRQDMVDPMHLHQAYQKFVGYFEDKESGCAPVASFVPVLTLCSERCIISVCS